MDFGESGLIRGVDFGESGLRRGVDFGESGTTVLEVNFSTNVPIAYKFVLVRK